MLDQAYMKLFPISLPPPDSFRGAVAVVTGGTSGLGLAAAAHLVNLGATEVIITSRDSQRAGDALATLQVQTAGRSRGVVRVLDLDMGDYNSVVRFAGEIAAIRKGNGGVDYILLNAGNHGVRFTRNNKTGCDQTIQVNGLSTVLLALLLLPGLKEESSRRKEPAHISITGSGMHTLVNAEQWAGWATEDPTASAVGKKGILAHLNREQEYPGPSEMYSASKLLVHYAAREISELAKGKDGMPQVIVNTCCPGIVHTDLSRGYAEKGRMWVAMVSVVMAFVGKSPEAGARTLIRSLKTSREEHGKFVRFYSSEAAYAKQSEELFCGHIGSKIQNQAWREMKTELASKVPAVGNVLMA